MTDLTANQTNAMTTLIESCLSNMGGDNLADLKSDPFTWVDVADLTSAGWGHKEAQGTFGSLVAAGLVWEAEHNTFALTEDWDKLYKYHP